MLKQDAVAGAAAEASDLTPPPSAPGLPPAAVEQTLGQVLDSQAWASLAQFFSVHV